MSLQSYSKVSRYLNNSSPPHSPEEFIASLLPASIYGEIKALKFNPSNLASYGVLGRYRSRLRGSGLEFAEVRRYVPGDEVRNIHWKVTARTNNPYVKSYREERDLPVYVLLDTGLGMQMGGLHKIKDHLAAQLSACLTLIACENQDRAAIITFDDKIRFAAKPRRREGAVISMLYSALASDISPAWNEKMNLTDFVLRYERARANIFVISDFLKPGLLEQLKRLRARHHLTACIVTDPLDLEIPAGVRFRAVDPTSGRTVIINGHSASVRNTYKELQRKNREELITKLTSMKISQRTIMTNVPLSESLRSIFSRMEIK
jgi:uncharacterized protein (DUF58 family)